MGILSNHSAWSLGPQALPDQLTGDPTIDFARFSSPWTSKGLLSGNMNIRHLLSFGEMIWNCDPTYQQAMRRVIGFFLTELEFYDPTHEGKLKEEDLNSYRDMFTNQLKAETVLYMFMENYLQHGNVMMSMLPPVLRRMQCPTCNIIHPVDVVASPENQEFQFKYHAKNVRYEAKCLRCGYKGDWTIYNMKADYRRHATVQFWNPKDFIMHDDPFTDRRLFTWQIPAYIRKRIKDGDPLLLSSAPLTMLQAVGEEKDYRFNEQTILHLREPTSIGINLGGWGMPPAVYSYSLSRYTFILRKMNEILASDYMIPVRVCSPARSQDNGGFSTVDTAWTNDMSNWNSQLRGIFERHRKDPAAIHTIGFPIDYQVLGGEGKSLVPGELLIQGEDMQLNANGVAPQLYRMDLNVQAGPLAIRLFESVWRRIWSACNEASMWMGSQVRREMNWKPCGIRLEPSKLADNMDNLLLLMQMVQAGAVAESTVLRKLGLDRAEEARKQRDDAMMLAELEAEQQQQLDDMMSGNSALRQAVDMQRMSMNPQMQQEGSGGMGAPVAGSPGGAIPPAEDPLAAIMAKIEQFGHPATPTTAQDMIAVAEEAAALFINLPEIEKRAKLREIEQKNKTMKELITSMMKEARTNQNREFIAQGQQMAQGATAPV